MRLRVLSLLLLLAVVAGCDEWTQFHGDGANSGFRAVRTEFARASEKWNTEVGQVLFSSPAIGPDGTLYVGNTDGELVAVRNDGVELWRFAVPNALFVTTPAVAPDGTIFLITGHPLDDGTMMSLLLQFAPDGHLLRFVPFPNSGFTTASPKIARGPQGYQVVTYVPLHSQSAPAEVVIFDDRLRVLVQRSLPVCRGDDDSIWEDIGEFFEDLWEGLDGFDPAELPGDVEFLFGRLHPTPAVTDPDDEGRVGIVAAGPCHVVAFEWQAPTLTKVWDDEITAEPMALSSPALMLDGLLAISGGNWNSDHGHVYAWDPFTGLRLWERKTGSPTIATPTSSGNRVYVATLDELVMLDDGDGKVVASRPYDKGIQTAASVALSANVGYISLSDQFLSFSYDLSRELLIDPLEGGGQASPAIGEDGTIYTVADGRLIAFGDDK